MKLKPYTGIRCSRVHNTFVAENVGLALNSFSIANGQDETGLSDNGQFYGFFSG